MWASFFVFPTILPKDFPSQFLYFQFLSKACHSNNLWIPTIALTEVTNVTSPTMTSPLLLTLNFDKFWHLLATATIATASWRPVKQRVPSSSSSPPRPALWIKRKKIEAQPRWTVREKPRWTVWESLDEQCGKSRKSKNGRYGGPTVFRLILATSYPVFVPITVFTE
jgi:hypothetical protein